MTRASEVTSSVGLSDQTPGVPRACAPAGRLPAWSPCLSLPTWSFIFKQMSGARCNLIPELEYEAWRKRHTPGHGRGSGPPSRGAGPPGAPWRGARGSAPRAQHPELYSSGLFSAQLAVGARVREKRRLSVTNGSPALARSTERRRGASSGSPPRLFPSENRDLGRKVFVYVLECRCRRALCEPCPGTCRVARTPPAPAGRGATGRPPEPPRGAGLSRLHV